MFQIDPLNSSCSQKLQYPQKQIKANMQFPPKKLRLN